MKDLWEAAQQTKKVRDEADRKLGQWVRYLFPGQTVILDESLVSGALHNARTAATEHETAWNAWLEDQA